MREFSAKKLRSSSNRVGLMLIMFNVLVISVSFAASKAFPVLLDESSANYDALTTIILFLIQYIVVVPLVMLVFRVVPLWKELPPMRSLFCKPKQSVWFILRWVVIILGLAYGANIATNMVMIAVELLTGFTIHSLTIETDNTLFSMVTTSFAVMILAPLFEELIFRADIFGDMKRHGSWSVIVFTGMMFGLWHCNFQQIPLAAILGAGSAFLVVKTGSVYPSLLVHFCLNTISNAVGLLSGLVNSGAPLDQKKLASGDTDYLLDNMDKIMAQGCIVFIIFGIIGIGVLLFLFEIIAKRDSFKLEDPFPEVSEIKKFFICLSAPAIIITIIAFTVMTVLNGLGI